MCRLISTCSVLVVLLVDRVLSARLVLVVFFFQAEDGIRDLVRSRGLGDVYKRQGIGDAGKHLRHREVADGGDDRVEVLFRDGTEHELSLIHI